MLRIALEIAGIILVGWAALAALLALLSKLPQAKSRYENMSHDQILKEHGEKYAKSR